MDGKLLVAIVVACTIVWQEVRFQLLLRANRQQLADLQLLQKAETAGDYVAMKSVLARPKPKPSKPRKPGLHEEMFGVKPSEE